MPSKQRGLCFVGKLQDLELSPPLDNHQGVGRRKARGLLAETQLFTY